MLSQITLTLVLALILVQINGGLTSETDLYKYTVLSEDNNNEGKSEENIPLESEHKQEAVINKTVDYGESDLDVNKNIAQSNSDTNESQEDRFTEYFNTNKSPKKKALTYKNIRTKSRKYNNTRVYKRLRSMYKLSSREEVNDNDDTILNVNSLGGYGNRINVSTTSSPITENYRGNKQRLVTTQDVLNINKVINQHVQTEQTETTSLTPAIVSEYGYATTESLNAQTVPIHPVYIPPQVDFQAILPITENQTQVSFLLPVTTEEPLQPLTPPKIAPRPEVPQEAVRATYLPMEENKQIGIFLQELQYLPPLETLNSNEAYVSNEAYISNSVDESDQNSAEGQLQPQIEEAPTEKPQQVENHQPYYAPQPEKEAQVEIQKSVERPIEYYFPNQNAAKPVVVEQRLPQVHHVPQVLQVPHVPQVQLLGNTLMFDNQQYHPQQTFYLPLELPKTLPYHLTNYVKKPYMLPQPYLKPSTPTIKMPFHQIGPGPVQGSYPHQMDLPKFLRPYPMVLNQHKLKNYRDPYSYSLKPSCAELRFMGIYKSYCGRTNINNNYIRMLPPKHTPYYVPRFAPSPSPTNLTTKFRKTRQNFESSIRMEYGFMPPLIPSLRIDEHGNPLEDQT